MHTHDAFPCKRDELPTTSKSDTPNGTLNTQVLTAYDSVLRMLSP